MNCSNTGLAGEFRIDCVDWTDVPNFFLPIQVLEAKSNDIVMVPEGAFSCKSNLPDLVQVDFSNNPLEWVGFSQVQLARDCQGDLKVASSLQACPIGANMERPQIWESNVCSCPANSYQPDQAIAECVDCPDNCVCAGNTMANNVQPRPNWWLSNDGGSFMVVPMTLMPHVHALRMFVLKVALSICVQAFRCVNDACCSANPNDKDCIGGRVCATGYAGAKCAVCEDG